MLNKTKIIQRIVIVNVSILISLFLCEGILRFVPSINNSRIASKKYKSQILWLDEETRIFRANINHEFEEAYRPEGEKYFMRTSPRLFRTDENGYILGATTNLNNFAEYKILFSGGSLVECQEVDEPCRFPYAVQSILNERGLPEIKTYNLGVRGHTTFETLKLMNGTSFFDGFEAICFMHNINDWTLLLNCGTYFSSSWDRLSNQHGSPKNQVNNMIKTSKNKLINNSSLAYLVNNWHQRYFSSDMIPQSEEPKQISNETVNGILRDYHKNILSLASLSKSKNSKPIFLTQPSPFKGILQEKMNNELKQICIANDYLLIDIAGDFPEKSEHLFFPDLVHLNNEGSLLVAQIIAEKLPFLLESSLSKLPISGKWLNKFNSLLQEDGIQSFDIPYNARYPVMDGNTKKLYFQSVYNGKSQICCVDLKDGLFRRISPFSFSFWHPCPDGSNSVYAVSNFLEGEKIFKLTNQDIQLLPIFDDEVFEGAIPAFSSSDNLCFPGSQGKQPPDLFMYSIQNKSLKQITKTASEEWRPVFHPDGRHLYYIGNEKGNFDIYSYDFKEDVSQYLIGTDGDDWDVDISPNGGQIVFAAQINGNFNLMFYDLNKKKLIRLTDGESNEWDPRFSPDGKIIMYAEELANKSSLKFISVPSL